MPFANYSATFDCGSLLFLVCRCIYWYFTSFEQNSKFISS